MQGPACPPPPIWSKDGAQRAACTRQVHYAALGTKGKGKGVGSAPPYAPLLVSSVPVCSQRPKHLAEEEAVEWQVLPPAWGSLGPWCLRGSAEILESKPRLTPLPSLLVGAGQAPETREGVS